MACPIHYGLFFYTFCRSRNDGVIPFFLSKKLISFNFVFLLQRLVQQNKGRKLTISFTMVEWRGNIVNLACNALTLRVNRNYGYSFKLTNIHNKMILLYQNKTEFHFRYFYAVGLSTTFWVGIFLPDSFDPKLTSFLIQIRARMYM